MLIRIRIINFHLCNSGLDRNTDPLTVYFYDHFLKCIHSISLITQMPINRLELCYKYLYSFFHSMRVYKLKSRFIIIQLLSILVKWKCCLKQFTCIKLLQWSINVMLFKILHIRNRILNFNISNSYFVKLIAFLIVYFHYQYFNCIHSTNIITQMFIIWLELSYI
jgi:hypothetical protein